MEELMAKYLADDLSEEERNSFETQLAADEAVSRDFEAYLNVWQLTHAPNSSISFDTTAAWEAVKERTLEESKVVPMTPKRPYSFLKIAATILILAVAGYFVATGVKDVPGQPSTIEVASENGLKELKLPDGSIVRLNANSKLTYSADFNTTDRVVTLIGEANFDVTRNEDLPFVVETGASRIQVLGTNFDITAYPNERVELNVTEGSVAFAAMAEVDQGTVVTGGQKATLDVESNQIEVSEILNLNFSGWWTRKFDYVETPMPEVLEDLEKAYLVEFEITDAMANCAVTSTFDNNTMEEVLTILKATFPGLESSKTQENKIKLSGISCSE